MNILASSQRSSSIKVCKVCLPPSMITDWIWCLYNSFSTCCARFCLKSITSKVVFSPLLAFAKFEKIIVFIRLSKIWLSLEMRLFWSRIILIGLFPSQFHPHGALNEPPAARPALYRPATVHGFTPSLRIRKILRASIVPPGWRNR